MNESVFALKCLGGWGYWSSMVMRKSGGPQTWHSPALHRVYSVISEIRPPSVAESGEAALRRLLASRAIGGYSVTSDNRTPGLPTVFQSSRAARPQDASKLRLLTRKPSWVPAGRHVDPVFHHSQLHDLGFVSYLVKAGSVGFERASNRLLLNPPSWTYDHEGGSRTASGRSKLVGCFS